MPLLRTRKEPNPGHGRRRVVEASAGRYQLAPGTEKAHVLAHSN
jgi:hypothetical protein